MDSDTAKLWIGTYPAEGSEPGSGEGIWQVPLDRRSGKLSDSRMVITTPSPSFLALHPSGTVLYAVSETSQGEVSAFALADGGLTHLRTVPTGGEYPCHVYAQQGVLWVANYGDGVVTQIPLDDDGVPSGEPELHRNSGSGPNPDRQEGPHAHYVHDVGNGEVWVSDLGTDELRRFTPSGPDGVAAVLPPGTGPRHLATLPDGAVVVVGEFDAQLHVLAADGSVLSSEPALGMSVPAETPAQPSHIAAGASPATANLLYAANRGPDVLSVFAADGDATLTHLSDTSVGGAWPRHFAVVPTNDDDGDLIIVANQSSSTLDVLRCDPSGKVQQVDSMNLPVPACVLPA